MSTVVDKTPRPMIEDPTRHPTILDVSAHKTSVSTAVDTFDGARMLRQFDALTQNERTIASSAGVNATREKSA